MKKARRKWLSCQKRDIWDNPRVYLFEGLSTARIKYKLKHRSKKDLKMKKQLEQILEWRRHCKESSENKIRGKHI